MISLMLRAGTKIASIARKKKQNAKKKKTTQPPPKNKKTNKHNLKQKQNLQKSRISKVCNFFCNTGLL